MMVQENTASFPHARKWRWLRGGMVIYLLITAAGVSFIFSVISLVVGSWYSHHPADWNDLIAGYSDGILSCYSWAIFMLGVQSPAWLGLAGCRLYWSRLVGPWISDPPGIGVWLLRQMAIAYLGIVVGIIITLYGFNLYLAINNPDFVWGIWDQIFVIFWKHLLLVIYVLITQIPGWLGLWLLNNPVNGSGKVARRPETRWEYHLRRGAIGYLIVSVIGFIVLLVVQWFLFDRQILGINLPDENDRSLFLFPFFLWGNTNLFAPILLLIQLPGWAILWWGWYQRRGVTMGQFVRGWGFNLWRKGVVGILWMSVAAAITLRFSLNS